MKDKLKLKKRKNYYCLTHDNKEIEINVMELFLNRDTDIPEYRYSSGVKCEVDEFVVNTFYYIEELNSFIFYCRRKKEYTGELQDCLEEFEFKKINRKRKKKIKKELLNYVKYSLEINNN